MINPGLASPPALFRLVPVLRAAVLYRQHNPSDGREAPPHDIPRYVPSVPFVQSLPSKVVPGKYLLTLPRAPRQLVPLLARLLVSLSACQLVY